jgi:hypothetical protein
MNNEHLSRYRTGGRTSVQGQRHCHSLTYIAIPPKIPWGRKTQTRHTRMIGSGKRFSSEKFFLFNLNNCRMTFHRQARASLQKTSLRPAALGTAKEDGECTRTRDCLTRQVRQAVLIRRSQVPVVNGKSEWRQSAL